MGGNECFFGHNIAGGSGGGGGLRDEPKGEQKIVVTSGVLHNKYLEGLFLAGPRFFCPPLSEIYLER